MNIKQYAKSFWEKLAIGGSVLIAASRSGKSAEFDKKCILYSGSDANRGHYGPDGYFSPILDPIQEHYKRQSYKAINLSFPLSYYHSSEVRGGAILLNRRAIVIILIELVEKLVLGKSIAAQRKSRRRVLLLKNMLSILKPNLIFAFQATQELCNAAHELDIAVVEPMHGMNLSPKDEIFRNTIFGIASKALPDAYLAYDDRTQATLTELIGDREIAVFRMPHPWHVECQNTDSLLFDGKRSSILFSSAKPIKILVALQWGYGGERDSLSNIIPNGILHPSVEQAIIENPDVLWLLRMHPVQIKARGYKSHRDYVQSLSERHPNVEWQDATALPLPTLLANVQGHITMTSGTAGEAAIFGVPSLLLCPTLKPGGAHCGWFAELIDSELAEFGELESEYITNWILRLSTTKPMLRRRDWKVERQDFAVTLNKVLETYGNV